MSDEEAAAFLAVMNDAPLFTPDAWVQLGIADPDGDQLIGDIGLFLAADGLSGEIGFTLAPSAQGRGIATEAVRKALELFFGLTSVERILGITDVRNAASVRLLQRAGFRYCETRHTVFRGEPCSEEIHTVSRNDV